jgi:outer membrane autotransporter protein
MKALIVAGAASFLAAPAFAGPYVNIETNAGYVDGEYENATTDFHVGYEGDIAENVGYYIQGGPALVNIDGAGTENEYSGKAGVGVDLSEQLSVYGEVSFLTVGQSFEDDLNVGAKAGVTFRF